MDLKMSERDSSMLRVDSAGEIINVKDAEKPTNGSFGDLNSHQEDIGRFSERIDATYPADCYSFLTLHGPFEKPLFFGFGILVWLFQMAFLLLMVLRVAGGKKLSENEDMDNPDKGFFAYFIPSNVSTLGRITQFIALLSYCVFADDSLKDIVKAVETFPNFAKAKEGDKVRCMVFSCILRFSQGALATIVVLLLVIQTQDVIDIILNFTAVNFISGFDDLAFELAQWGKYGPIFKAEANRIETLTVPDCIYRKYDHVRYRCTILPVAIVLILAAASIAIGQDSDDVWLTQRLRVQFQDNSVFEDYSGCYELDRNSTSWMRKRENYASFEANPKNAKFGYCDETRKWILYEGNSTDACDISEDSEIAHSTKTYNFDISMSFEETWYSPSGKPLQLYFFEEENSLTGTQCSSFLGDGICNSYFNLAGFGYDEGDCCSFTCTDVVCGSNLMTEAFDTDIVVGNGYPNCKDPTMKPLTIVLNRVFTDSGVTQFMDSGATQGVQEPLMILDCDDKNVMMVSISEKMINKTETVMVADGANCIMMVKNSTVGDGLIWYLDYSIFHGDKDSIDRDPILITQGDSSQQSITYFQRIKDCILTKLEEYIDKSTVYTAMEPSNQAIRWLAKDSKYSNCERSDFLERFALAAINFAAPVELPTNNQGLWINPRRICVWRAVGCTGSVVTELNYNALGAGNISGSIASEIGILKNLTAIDFTGCNLVGTIPTEIGQLGALKTLAIHKNNIGGTIPSEIGGLAQLQILMIAENVLTGSIPAQIGKLTALTDIQAYINYLTGSIPSDIGNLLLLNNLILDGNSLSGSLPSAIGNLSNLQYFGISYNSITGQIPSELGNIGNLEYILFDVNNLSGNVPLEILQNDLIDLGVYGNRLSDLIPVNGTVICTEPEGNLGEHYCNCKNDCMEDPVFPDRCVCDEAQECCAEFFYQFEHEPCIICNGSFVEPDRYVPEFQSTCFYMARFIAKGIEQFGEPGFCREIAFMSQEWGCRCNGRLPYDECIPCEFGLENPDFYLDAFATTCHGANEFIRRNVSSYGTESLCDEARAGFTELGCRCKVDPALDLEDEPVVADFEERSKCIVCEYGLENPDFFLDEYQAHCFNITTLVEENTVEYGKASICNKTKTDLVESGCRCKNELDFQENFGE